MAYYHVITMLKIKFLAFYQFDSLSHTHARAPSLRHHKIFCFTSPLKLDAVKHCESDNRLLL